MKTLRMISSGRAAAMTAKLTAMTEEAHNAAIRKSVSELTEGEKRATRADGPRTHLVNYRVRSRDESSKGTSAQRRAHLIALIRAFPGAETHLATSAWLIRSHQAPASILVDILSEPLDAQFDFVSVVPIATKPVTFGKARLEP